jgi:hypothetical protein
MFVWPSVPNGLLAVSSPPGIAGDYDAARGCWGGALSPPTTGNFQLAVDGSGTNQGCGPFVGFTPGNLALIDRGTCEFSQKAVNAQNAGAAAAVIVNDQQLPNGIIVMGSGASGGSVTIPTVMIGNSDGQIIKDQLAVPTAVTATVEPNPGSTDRDSDLDNGIIAHEYGHGISNRLVGGPSNVNCLGLSEQMGEGWSDFWTLVLTADAGDTRTSERGIGTYVLFEPTTGDGLRNFPYTTDPAVNPQAYADVATTNQPHGVGEIWALMLWEMYWNLVAALGFDADLVTGSGGNNLAIQLVVDGMKMTPCNPTFVTARDAILAADAVSSGGVNQCQIWKAFAKRGLGVGASGGTANVGDEVEDFTLPAGGGGLPDCVIFADGFESGDTSAWSGAVP